MSGATEVTETAEAVQVAADAVPARPLRADAERNRRVVLDVAARVFAERGLGATLNDIAREAGVGVGTVYRRFPDKDALVAALFDVKFTALLDLVRAAAEVPSPGQGLREFIAGAAQARARDRGLGEVLAGAGAPSGEAARKRELLHSLVGELLARAQAEGTVRPDVAASDVPMFMLMVGAVADGTRDLAPDTWQRYAHLLIDSLRPVPGQEPLGQPPLDAAGVAIALQRRPG